MTLAVRAQDCGNAASIYMCGLALAVLKPVPRSSSISTPPASPSINIMRGTLSAPISYPTVYGWKAPSD